VVAVVLALSLAGCGAAPPTATPTATPTTTPTATPTATPTTTPTATPTPARGGLLVVSVVDGPPADAVRYDRARIETAPTLDAAVRRVARTGEPARRDLSAAEVDRVESVASAYGVPTSDLVIVRNGTAVEVSLAYEL
jgi:hypothetical protein